MTTLTSTLYLGTDSLVNPPLNMSATNKNNLSWNVNWDSLFNGQRPALCKVSINLLSSIATTTGLNTSEFDFIIGTIRGNFGSNFCSNNSNGVVLAHAMPNSIAGSNTSFYYTGVTESNHSPTINTPTGSSLVNIKFCNLGETGYIPNIPDFCCVLTFEWISNETVQKYIS